MAPQFLTAISATMDSNTFKHEKGTMTSMLCLDADFVLTAGTDRVVRFWDLADAGRSYRISSPGEVDTSPPCFHAHYDNHIVVFEEVLTAGEERNMSQNGLGFPASSHHDAIMDMVAVQYPENMLVTAGRSGVIKVWL